MSAIDILEHGAQVVASVTSYGVIDGILSTDRGTTIWVKFTDGITDGTNSHSTTQSCLFPRLCDYYGC